MSYHVLDIANKLIAQAAFCDAGELMTNMKLQKMLYYEQGYHLAAFGTPLFEEEIEAWMYGPVVPSVYNHFSNFGSNGIPANKEDNTRLTKSEEELFFQVFEAYNEFSAIGLMNKTHNESPWTSTPIGKGNVIDKDKMGKFFIKYLEDE